MECSNEDVKHTKKKILYGSVRFLITCGSPQSRAGAGDESKYKSGVKNKTKQQKRKRKAFIQVAISNFSPSLDLNIQNLSFLRFDFPFSPLKPPRTERHLALFNNNNKKRNTENDGLKLLLLTLNMSSNPPLYICGPLHICSYSDVKCFTHQAQCVSAFTVIHVWRKNKVTFNKKKQHGRPQTNLQDHGHPNFFLCSSRVWLWHQGSTRQL